MIAGLPLNHAKYVIIDREIVLISSMNLDGRHLPNGYEVGIVIRDKTLGELIGALTDYLVENASHTISCNPKLIDLANKTTNKPIIVNRLLIRTKTKNYRELEKKLKSELVAIYKNESKSTYVLRIGDEFYEIHVDPGLQKIDDKLVIDLENRILDNQKLREQDAIRLWVLPSCFVIFVEASVVLLLLIY